MADDEAPIVQAAHTIRTGYCKDGFYHVELLDEGGRVFGRASMDREQLAQHMGDCADVIEQVAVGGVALMPAGGEA